MIAGKTGLPDKEKQIRRLLRFLCAGPATIEPSAGEGRLLLSGPDGATISMREKICRQMISDGLVTRDGAKLNIHSCGKARLRRNENGWSDFSAQHRDIRSKPVRLDNGISQDVTINLAESPLIRLAKIKNRSGRPFLEAAECQAGERLRCEFTRGQMAPRLGIDWGEPIGRSPNCGGWQGRPDRRRHFGSYRR